MRGRMLLSLFLVFMLVFPPVAIATGVPGPVTTSAPPLADVLRARGLSVGISAVDDDIPGVPIPASPFSDTLDAVDTADVYAVQLDAGEVFVADMTGDAGTDFDLYAYGPQAASIIDGTYVEAASTGSTSTEHIAFTAWSTDTYYVSVEGFGDAGAYTLTWSITAPAADDNIPGVVLPASPVNGALDMGTDYADVHAVTLGVNDRITADLTGDPGTDFDLYLYDMDATSIWDLDSGVLALSQNDSSSTESIEYAVFAAGTYYLSVEAYQGAGNYTLTWAIEPGEPDDDIPGVPLPSSPVAGSLSTDADTDDVYRVALEAGDVIDVAMTGPAEADFELELLGPGISSIWAEDYPDFILDGSYSDGSEEHVSVTAAAAGTYYVYVYAYQGAGSYTLTWSINGGTPTNTAPVAVNDAYAVDEDQTLAVPAPGFLGNDTDAESDPLTVSWRTEPAHGFLTVDAAGAIGYVPDLDFSGTDSFSYRVSDGTLESNTAVVTITVNPVNDAPVLASIGNRGATVGAQLAFTATATDVDNPTAALTFSLGAGAPAGAAITPSGAFTWTPGAVGTYPVTVVVSDGALTDFEAFTITVAAAPAGVTTVEVAGANRYATAIAASKKAFASSEYVVIATGMNWPDALGGSALAGALDAPILLTATSSLPAEVRAEIVRLGATKAIVLGGTPAVSAAVMGQIDAISGVGVERISGPNRYDTANAVAARTIAVMRGKPGGYDGTAFIATGANFPDALGASPLAAAAGWPIYLANPAQGNNAGLVAVMKAAGVTDAILLGGANVVSDAIKTPLGTTYETRLAGANRYDTAIAVATYGVAHAGLGWDKVALATGENFPDALAGGVLQGADGSVLLLTPTNSLNAGVGAKLAANKASILEVRFLGSTAAVSQAARTAVLGALK